MKKLQMKSLFVHYNDFNENPQEEYFAKVVYNNRIIDDYYISSHGRVWSVRWQRFLSQSPDKDGYMRVNIVIDGKSKTVKVHRLVLMTFRPIEEPDKYVGNHIDGVVTHNNLEDNLEWATMLDNTRHGWDTGLNHNKGEGNVRSRITEDEARKICGFLEKGYRACDICNEFNVTDKVERMRFSAIISSIANLKSFRYISKDYDINGSKGKDRYSLEFADSVCQLLYNKDAVYTDEQIMDKLNIPDIDRPKFAIYLNDLRRERTAKDVVRKYKEQMNHNM